ncbi:hypothetical protein O6H91_20G051600 [Diphasiastrum complanatum]|uniref:Uncharacterized protein n=1 Tax=Diphasiastrum complanatum TaxID=34168 RepID=A0ACC2AQC1_DIPCM|nr:hypothetical protein O6H91_20G051600 [Diphasiastrum complanatum]
MAAEEAPGFFVGQRVQSVNAEKQEQIGTVRYIGPVEGHKGLWIGVDWDNGQGRHNGSVNGVRYFQTSTESSGSFVRSQNLSTGVTFLKGIYSRYRAPSSDQDQDEMYVMSVTQKRVGIELVGKNKIEEKQHRLDELYIASLSYAGVAFSDKTGEIKSIVPNIEELDLTGNLLPDWHTVGSICKELTSLRVLDLSCNRLALGPSPLPMLSGLKTLVLNRCQVTWKQIESLRGCLPVIEELHLGDNNLTTIEIEGQNVIGSSENSFATSFRAFRSLRLLNLEDNCIKDWEEVLKLAVIESLEQLLLSGNEIQKIYYPETSSINKDASSRNKQTVPSRPFEKLRSLLIGRNKIEDWTSVDALDSFPSLVDIRLSENPLTDPTLGGAPRYILIARLSKVTHLNGSEVRQRERLDSEIRYVRHVLSSMRSGMCEDIKRQHPRFEYLQKHHDIPEETARIGGLGVQKLAASLLSITLSCVASSVGERAPVTKKLPISTAVGKLKLVCEAVFKVKAVKQRLFLKDKDSPLPLALDNDTDTLGDLGIGMDAVVLVDELESC